MEVDISLHRLDCHLQQFKFSNYSPEIVNSTKMQALGQHRDLDILLYNLNVFFLVITAFTNVLYVDFLANMDFSWHCILDIITIPDY